MAESTSEMIARLTQENLANRPVSAVSAPKSNINLSALTSTGTSSSSSAHKGGALNWALDMLSRPLHAVEGGFIGNQKYLKQSALDFTKGDILGGIGNGVRSLANGINKEAWQGLTTPNSENKFTGANVIEKTADSIGSVDPNYKDVQNNVDPVTKGIGGFAIDIAADPLTYIPGPDLIKGAKTLREASILAKNGFKAADEGAVAGIKSTLKQAGQNVADRAAQKAAVKAEAKAIKNGAKPSSVQSVVEPAVDQIPVTPQVVNAPKVAEAAGQKVAKAADKITPVTSGSIVKNAAQQAGEGTVSPERVKVVADYLKNLAPQEAKQVATAIKDVSAAKPLTQAEFAAEKVAAGKPVAASVDHVAEFNKVLNAPDIPSADAAARALSQVSELKGLLAKKGKVAGYDKPISVHQVVRDLAGLRLTNATNTTRYKGLTAALNSVVKGVQKSGGTEADYAKYLDQFTKAQASGKLVNAAGEDIAKAAPDAATATISNQLTNFQEKLAANRAAVEAALGKGTTRVLSQITKPESFDKTVEQMNRVIADGFDTSELGKMQGGAKRLAEELGIVPPRGGKQTLTVPPAVDALPAKEAVPAITDGALQSIPGLTPEQVSRASQAVSEAFSHVSAELDATREFGTAAQYALVKSMERIVNDAAPLTRNGNRALGKIPSGQRRGTFLDTYKASRMVMDHMGFPVTMGKGTERIPLGYDELLESISKSDDLVGLYQFNPQGAVAPTNLMDAAVAVYRGERDPDVIAALVSHNVLDEKGVAKNPILKTASAQLGGTELSRNDLIQRTVAALLNSADDVASKVETNMAAHLERRSTESLTIADQAIQHMADVMANGTVADSIKSMRSITPDLKVAQTAMHAMDESRELAKPIVEGAMNPTDLVSSSAMRGVENKTKNAFKTVTSDPAEKAVTGSRAEAQKKSDAFGQEFTGGTDSINFSDKFDGRLAGSTASKIVPFLGRFEHDLGMKQMGPEWRRSQAISRSLLHGTSVQLNALQKLGTDVVNQAFSHVKTGIPVTDPQVKQASDIITKLLDGLLTNKSADAVAGTQFLREGASLSHFTDNLLALSGKQSYQFDVNAARAAAKANGTDTLEELSKQWTQWKIEDPIDFVWHVQRAAIKTAEEQSIAQTFHQAMLETGNASRAYRQGLAKAIAPNGKSILQRYLDPEMYYNKDMLAQVHAVDSAMQQSLSLNSDFGKFVTKYMDPLQNLWKQTLTIYRPGHHIRNLVGDMSLTFLSGITDPRVYRKALGVIGTRGSYTDVDMAKALMEGRSALPTAGKVVSRIKLKGGKKAEVTADGMYKAAFDEGILPNFHTLEDLNDVVPSTFGERLNAVTAITGGRASKIAGGVSEYRDHYVRLAHFIGFVEKYAGKYATEKELYEAAGRVVRKWHPDGSGLTAFERKYARRLVPFYSWQRTAIPLIVESMLTRPGRVLAFPKAQFGLAEASGVDPNSLSDPFPNDQLFPSWLTETANGPVAKVGGKYYSISPGFASQDVLQDYVGANPIRTIAGSVNPFIKIPGELLGGTNWGTGAPITNTGEYIEGQIPNMSYFTSLTGVSPINTIATGQITPTTAVQKGNKTPFDPVVVANYLSGLGISDQSKPSYIKSAQLEARNAAKGN